MSPAFGNLYHKRKVADTASKACFVCYKPSSTVLVTSDGRSDFFYICESHLLDGAFASVEPTEQSRIAAEEDKEKQLRQEVEMVKKKWAEKKDKDSKQSQDKEKEKEKEKEKIDEKSEKNLPEISSEKADPARLVPRIFVLDASIYSLRLKRKRDAEFAQKQKERTQSMLSQPNLFPKVPKKSVSGVTGPTDPASGDDLSGESGNL